MKLRAPATPLLTIDPFFSLWSMSDTLNGQSTKHWTGKDQELLGLITIDGTTYQFMGHTEGIPKLNQTHVDIKTLSTHYIFEGAGIQLVLTFMTPLFQKDYAVMTRPIGYVEANYIVLDGQTHDITISLKASEALCLNHVGELPVTTTYFTQENLNVIKMGSTTQPVLTTCGDDHRINWGYLYLSADHATVATEYTDGVTFASISKQLDPANNTCLFLIGYDDISSMVYFDTHLKSYWNQDGKTLEDILVTAFNDYTLLMAQAEAFHLDLVTQATQVGSENYAELLVLSYRQVMSAHKLVCDTNGDILYISKECFSNGCAATVDVSYPSIPLYLHYDTELIKGMLRPIFRYAASDVWPFDFAPHDAGTYPHVNGQVYSNGTDPEHQMPVEECGNMLIMAAAITKADGHADFAKSYLPQLTSWADYLVNHGLDPNNQLCTDDFAGHLAHNCNLSVKAILGIASMGIICEYLGHTQKSVYYLSIAQAMAKEWGIKAANEDGSYRLAFDQPDTYSLKYNLIWDKLFKTNLFPQSAIESELASYLPRLNPYGMPLDSRETYTKSDWLVWAATLSNDPEYFKTFINTLWDFYNTSPSRVPMTDWYQTITGKQVMFQNRTVQGGLFIKLLDR